MNTTIANSASVPVDYHSDQQEDEIDLANLFLTLIENKWLIITMTVVGLSLGVFKAFRDIPIYKTDVMLQVEGRSDSLDALEPVAALLESEMPIMGEIEIIKSRSVLGEAVKNLNLEIVAQPHYFPIIGEAIARRYQPGPDGAVSEALFGLPQYAWGGEAIRVGTFEIPSEWFGKEFTLLAGQQGHYRLLYEGEPVIEGEVGKLATREIGHNRQPLKLFVSLLKSRPGTEFQLYRQSLGSAIEQLKGKLNVAEKGKGSGIIEATLEIAKPKMAIDLLDEIANIYVRRNVEQKSAEAQKTLKFLEKQLPQLKDQLESATTALNDFRARKGSVDLNAETQGVLESVVENKTQITLLQQKREELRQKFTPQHPTIIAIDRQIARLQAQMKSDEKKIAVLPKTQQVILKLSRDVEVSNELYTTLLNNAQTLRVAKAGTVGDVRVIDYAAMPTEPIKPKKALIIAIATFLGLIVGIVAAFVRKSMHRGVEDPDLIEKHLNIPVYASIPHSEGQAQLGRKIKRNQWQPTTEEPAILALQDKDDQAVESLRSLRTTLHFAFLEAANNIIMITGPSPNIGKSFVSLNLASVLSDAGKKILLIDADMRRGEIHKSLGVERENGLSDLISDSVSFFEAIHKVPETNLDFLSTGAVPPNPSELLMHEKFGQLLKKISQSYDYVIIDSPPILAVTDAGIIGRQAGATLMVVKAGWHPMRELEQSTKRLMQAGVNIKGAVFNNVPIASSRYGYGYGYGYKGYVYQYNYQQSN